MHFSQCWREFISNIWKTAMAIKRLTNFSDEVKEGRSSVRVKEERVEQMNKVVGL